MTDPIWVETITILLFGLLLTIGILIGRTRSLFAAVMMSGIFSLLSAALFVVMDAVDVAFTEACSRGWDIHCFDVGDLKSDNG